jgi:general secretion pathway protein C
MSAAAMAFLTWAAVTASAVYWGFQLFVPGAPTPQAGLTAARAPAAQADLARVLGAAAAAPRPAPGPATAVEGRFKLVGVVAPAPGAPAGGGIALLQVDGKPARSLRVGAPVDGDWIVQRVDARSATLGPEGGAAALTLELPAAPVAARGGAGAVGAAPAPQPAAPRPPTPGTQPAPGGDGSAAPVLEPPPAGDGNAPTPSPGAGQDGRVPSPEPGALRRPGPLTR